MVFGHKVIASSHVVTKTKSGTFLLMVGKSTIGDHAFIGAGTRIGPNVAVEERALVSAATDIHVETIDLHPKATVSRT